MALIITFEGKTHTFDQQKITVDEWRELKRKYGMTPKGFDEGIGEADPDASTFLYWLLLRLGGDMRTPLNDELKPDIIALNAAIAEGKVDVPELPGGPYDTRFPPGWVDPSVTRFYEGDIGELRDTYLFALAKLCGLTADDIGRLTLHDFRLYVTGIDSLTGNDDTTEWEE